MSSVVHEDVALKIREAFIRKVHNLDLTVRRVLISELIQVFCKYIFCNNCKLVFSSPNQSVKFIYEGQGKQQNHRLFQGYKARKVNCSCAY